MMGTFTQEPQHVIKRKCYGCDWNSEQQVLLIAGSAHALLTPSNMQQPPAVGLFWWLSRKQWEGRVEGYRHAPAELVLRVRVEGARSTTSVVLHTGGRLSYALVMQHRERVANVFRSIIGPDADRFIDRDDFYIPNRTQVWSAP